MLNELTHSLSSKAWPDLVWMWKVNFISVLAVCGSKAHLLLAWSPKVFIKLEGNRAIFIQNKYILAHLVLLVQSRTFWVYKRDFLQVPLWGLAAPWRLWPHSRHRILSHFPPPGWGKPSHMERVRNKVRDGNSGGVPSLVKGAEAVFQDSGSSKRRWLRCQPCWWVISIGN